MKRILKKPLVVAMMLGFALVSTSVDASDGKSLKIENLDNKENYYPHRAPARYSIKAVGHLDSTKGIFNISFFVDVPCAEIEIYKDGVLVTTDSRSLCIGDTAIFDLSMYGSGEYQVVVGIEEDDLYGSFHY